MKGISCQKTCANPICLSPSPSAVATSAIYQLGCQKDVNLIQGECQYVLFVSYYILLFHIIPAFISSWSPSAACNIAFSAVHRVYSIHSGTTGSVRQLAMNHILQLATPKACGLAFRLWPSEETPVTSPNHCITLCNDSASSQVDFTRHTGCCRIRAFVYSL